MRRMISSKAQKYIKDLATNHPDPSAEWGGSGSEYTAGEGIDISEDVISVNNEVKVLPTYGITPEKVAGVGNMTLAQMIDAGLPILSTDTGDAVTDYPYEDNVISLAAGDEFRVQGYFGVATDATNGYVRVYTTANNGLQDNKLQYVINMYKNGTNDYMLFEARYRSNLSGRDTTIYDIIPSNEGDIGISGKPTSSPVNVFKTAFLISNPIANTRYGSSQLNPPTVQGNYVLGASVNSSGNPTFAWNTQPTLATVATTGDYDDLTNKPTIPDAVSGTNDGTNWTNLTIGSDTYAIPAGGSADAITYNDLTSGFYKESPHDIKIKIEGTNPINVEKLSQGSGKQLHQFSLNYDKTILGVLNKKLTTAIGGGYKDTYNIDKTTASSTSDVSGFGVITDSNIVDIVKTYSINYVKSITPSTS